jgi:uncharacterized protein (TIGR01777 family)
VSDPRIFLISGATGLVGQRLVTRLLGDGAVVRALTRDQRAASNLLDTRVLPVRWDGVHVPVDAVNGTDVVVHLAGEPIFGGRLTRSRRARIRASRVDTTRALVRATSAMREADRPEVLICASAVGVYGERGEEPLEEDAAPGRGFLAELCRDWEAEAEAAEAHGVRAVEARIGVVLAREGGALPQLARTFRLGLGGRLGNGRQWFPWIHLDDLVELIRAAARDPGYRGPLNAVSPHPVRNREFAQTLARQLRRPALLPVPALALRAVLGELAGELLESRRVVPRAALDRGFAFRHESLKSALAAELGAGEPGR